MIPSSKNESEKIGQKNVLDVAYEQFLCLLDQARQSEEKKGGKFQVKQQ